MTEAKWLKCGNPFAMAGFLCDERGLNRKPIGRRKLRLFACACCRRAWHLLDDERSRQAVEVAERYADAAASKLELPQSRNRGESSFRFQAVCDQIGVAIRRIPAEASFLLGLEAEGTMKKGYRATVAAEEVVQVALLRDIFGNPFRPVAFSPDWHTDTAIALARTMYDSRDFGAMPILADALQDAGCDSDDILSHCRDSKQVHVRGCWVVDLVLGKA